MKRFILLSLLFISLFSVAFALTEPDNSNYDNVKEVVYNNQSSYGTGYTNWSTTAPSVSEYVKAPVYLAVKTWNSESCSTTTQTTNSTTESGTVKKLNRSYKKYAAKDVNNGTECAQGGTRMKSTCWTSCGAVDAHNGECGQVGCTFYHWESESYCVSYKTKYTCGTNYTSDTDTGCDSKTYYCYSEASTFADSSDSSNWKASLSEAGGYAKKIYVYSYAQIYTNTLNYDANGGDGAPDAQTATVTYPNTQSTFTLSSTIPTRTGYTFAGWYTDKEGGTKVTETYTVGETNSTSGQSVTLYAHWTVNYTRYIVDCITDNNDTLVVKDIDINGTTYKIKEMIFDIPETEKTVKTFCIGKLKSTEKVSY